MENKILFQPGLCLKKGMIISMNTTKINKYEGIAFVLIIIINLILVNLPKISLSICGTSAWINVIYVSILAFLFVLFICKVFQKFPNHDIIDISEFLGGKFLKVFTGIAYLIFFSFLFIMTIKYFSESFKLIYFQNIDIFFIILLFLIGAIFANSFKTKAIFKTCLLVTILVLVSLCINYFVLSSNFVPERMFPIFR